MRLSPTKKVSTGSPGLGTAGHAGADPPAADAASQMSVASAVRENPASAIAQAAELTIATGVKNAIAPPNVLVTASFVLILAIFPLPAPACWSATATVRRTCWQCIWAVTWKKFARGTLMAQHAESGEGYSGV